MLFIPQLVGRFAVAGAVFFAATCVARAQTAPPEEKVYTYVEQMPELPGGGGAQAVVVALQRHVMYPTRAVRARAEGRVFVNFTVAASGSVENIAVIIGFRPDCDSAAVVAVQQLPPFLPGKQQGKLVAVQFTVPVTFRLPAPPPGLVQQGK